MDETEAVVWRAITRAVDELAQAIAAAEAAGLSHMMVCTPLLDARDLAQMARLQVEGKA